MPHRFLALLFVLTSGLCAAEGASETIRIRADVWAPYNAQPDGDHPGLAIEMAKEIFAAHGIAIDYQVMPWARAIQACKSGEVDAIIGATGLEFDGVVIGSQPMVMCTNALVGLADQPWTYHGLASLDQVQIAYPRGYNYTPEVDAYLRADQRRNITEIGGEEPLIQAVALLERKRVDAYIEDRLVFFSALPEEKKKAFKVLGQLSEPAPFYLAFTPANPNARRWAELLDQGLVELKRSGRHAAILARYGIIEAEFAALPLSASPAP